MAQLWQTVIFCLLAWSSGAMFSVGWMEWRRGAPGAGDVYYGYSDRRVPSRRRRLRRQLRAAMRLCMQGAILLAITYATVQGSILLTTQMTLRRH